MLDTACQYQQHGCLLRHILLLISRHSFRSLTFSAGIFSIKLSIMTTCTKFFNITTVPFFPCEEIIILLPYFSLSTFFRYWTLSCGSPTIFKKSSMVHWHSSEFSIVVNSRSNRSLNYDSLFVTSTILRYLSDKNDWQHFAWYFPPTADGHFRVVATPNTIAHHLDPLLH